MGLGDTPSWRSLPWTPPQCGDPGVAVQVYVAAFAVSAYASTFYRAGSKPFNPVLGETYECVRPDRGFRFISEQVLRDWGGKGAAWGGQRGSDSSLVLPQVSHHPPISACHAESDNFVFWQGGCGAEGATYGVTKWAGSSPAAVPQT